MEKPKQEKSKSSIHAWFGWILATLIVIVICVKIVFSDYNFSQLNFQFTDFLSIILALFAVWISINFYHKNNEASAKFYNNTYTFTKDISENLGRIEERFGEKLESLKEENKSLSSRVERYYSNGSSKKDDIEKEEKKEKEIQEKLKSELNEKDELLNELVQKYQIAEKDKEEFLERINQKNEEVQKLEKKLKLFEKSKLKMDSKYNVPSRLVNFLKIRLNRNKEFRDVLSFSEILGEDEFKDTFYKESRRFHKGFQSDLIKYDLVDDDQLLTEEGVNFVSNVLREVEGNDE
ncbi:hypothetical protein [Salinimicrobium gaetbulicola]|uniref:Uncharacterized protein n=1 Tax=Salinimicrobium gaetbulicola TaxID=999702 RepID=A0ABW3IFF4_9FLAO